MVICKNRNGESGNGMREMMGMREIRVVMSRGIQIKGNERIYKNTVLTFWYEKQLK